MPETPARPAQPGTAYVLVHPEAHPSNTWDVDDDAYGAAVRAAAAVPVRVAVLDEYALADVRDDDADLTVGVPADGWTLLGLEPHDLTEAALPVLRQALPGVTDVLLGGYHRDDCVARVADLLTGAGYRVRLHEASTLPYPGMRPIGV